MHGLECGSRPAGVGCTGRRVSSAPAAAWPQEKEAAPCLALQKPQPPDGARAAFCLPDVIGSQGKAGEGAANGDYAARGSGRMRLPSSPSSCRNGRRGSFSLGKKENRSSSHLGGGAGEE